MLASGPFASWPFAGTPGAPVPAGLIEINDAIAMLDTGTHRARGVLQVLEACAWASAHQQTARQGFALADGFGLGEIAAIVYRITGESGIALAEVTAARARQVIALVDLFAASGIASSRLVAIHQVASALAAADVAAFAAREEIEDAMAIGALVAHSLKAYQSAVESIALEDSPAMRARFVTLVDEAVVFDAIQSHTARLVQMIRDGLSFALDLAIEDGRYLAWVVNAETRAAWSYSNYGFNSFAQLSDGDYFGAMDDGIYLLEGETDAGAIIRSTVRTGPFDFNSPAIKRLPAMYVAATRDGELLVKVLIDTPDGASEAHWYRLQGGAAPRLRQDKVENIDKGLEALEFAFELVNVNGADFEIDALQLLPLITSRRI